MESTTKDIAHLTEIVHNFLEMNGTLSMSQYKQFWNNLCQDQNASTNYFAVLFAKLITVDLGIDKNGTLMEVVKKLCAGEGPMDGISQTKPISQSSLSSDEVFIQRHSLLNTLYFLCLFFPVELDATMKNTIQQKWSQNAQEKSFVDEVLKMAGGAFFEGNDAIITFVDQCSNIDFPVGFDFGPDKLHSKQLSSSHTDFYLRSSLTRGAGKLILETILLFLKHPLLTEKRMLSLLHMLKQYVILCPEFFPETLVNGLNIVKSYYLWPRPYGDVARDVLQLMSIELKAPGESLRKKLIEENPDILKGHQLTPSKTGRERIVHVLLDQNLTSARTIQEIIKSHTVSDVSAQQLQLNLLAHIICTNLNCPFNSLGFEFLSRDDVSRLLEQALQILSQAVLMNFEDAEIHRLRELTSLKDEIVGLIVDSSGKSSVFQKPRPIAALPPLNFQFIPVNCDNTAPKDDKEIDSTVRFPRRQSVDALTNIFAQYAPFADPKNKPIIRVAIVGSDGTLHNVLQAFAFLKCIAPKSFHGLEPQFFLIPSEVCGFANFISRYDGWYARHIACLPQSVLRAFPSIALPQLERQNSGSTLNANDKAKTWNSSMVDRTMDELSKLNLSSNSGRNTVSLARRQKSLRVSTEHQQVSSVFQAITQMYEEDEFSKPPTPGSVLRSEFENYLREAKWKLEVNMYSCECWDENFSFSVPFCQRVEIGLKPFNKVSQQLGAKAPKYNAPSLSIKYTQMNVLGVPKQGAPIDAKPFHAIQIANIPQFGDRGIPPNPTKPWLEMYTMETDQKKRKTKPSERELETNSVACYHVSVVDIEVEDKKKENFHVLIDNVLYGPFVRIRISNCSKTEDPVTIPFMTFFPLDLPS
mmetsp:Transcript_21886/g.30594  ORF Transcript_21886/g.30594 Transcript_21886/m.30594 type:complete len:867 (+) Transcript_21886:249-2849(+)|eukprot:CAMPEP_0168561916 /NCGR_PEP_ID=MMETSP0413-20121227/11850_1 /TAXON_ID=136452 /ORGANISM="Filamoeba nolandi, Strain NC-AS-23-1" /LENGTH=866 /DNA_ID=CAMNT_0008593319 /DNA_START=184 /DNA_END=2784 /DNA_ORIENTATION=+